MIYDVSIHLKGPDRDNGLNGQIRGVRCFPMLIVPEGFGCYGDKEFANFLNLTHGSLDEVQNQLYVAIDLNYIDKDEFDTVYNFTD